jgi:hypothetical protein
MSTLVEQPTFTRFVDQKFIVEPLGGPKHIRQYTDRFPEDFYRLTHESHLVRFLYALIGPAGVGWLRKQTMDARLALEGQGLAGFNLDDFYGDPMSFGRIVEEQFEQDPTGLLPKDQWEAIRSKDAAYRSRAIDYLNGAKAGNTPLGMHLVARSGLGHECEVIENYKYLFDIHSDNPLGVTNYGSTDSLQEMIVLPRRETSRSEIQRITITGNPTGGTFVLFFNGQNTIPLAYNCNRYDVQNALWALPNIGNSGVEVIGGPAPAGFFDVYFRGPLANRDVPDMTVEAAFTGGSHPQVTIDTATGGQDPSNEVVAISPQDRHALQSALDRIRPVGTIPTLNVGEGLRERQDWNTAFASSEYHQVLRYVSGNPAILWPTLNSVNWIERHKEKEAPRIFNDLQFHYQGFHNISGITSYTEAVLEDSGYLADYGSSPKSEHTGRFGLPQRQLAAFQYLADNTDDQLVYTADRALADYAEPLTVTTQANVGSATTSMINGIYPATYASLPGVPQIQYKDEQFWASLERPTGDEYLEIDLGRVRAVNYIAFEVSKKPINLELSLDTLDLPPTRRFGTVYAAVTDFPVNVTYNPEETNPWQLIEWFFEDRKGRIPYARYIRIRFSRANSEINPFLFDIANQFQHPWSIEVKNLRVGRNISNF